MTSLVYLIIPSPPLSALFPYTTLFRSRARAAPAGISLDREPDAPGYERLRRNPQATPPRRIGLPIQRNSDRKSTRLKSSHVENSYAVFCLKKKNYIVINVRTLEKSKSI